MHIAGFSAVSKINLSCLDEVLFPANTCNPESKKFKGTAIVPVKEVLLLLKMRNMDKSILVHWAGLYTAVGYNLCMQS